MTAEIQGCMLNFVSVPHQEQWYIGVGHERAEHSCYSAETVEYNDDGRDTCIRS